MWRLQSYFGFGILLFFIAIWILFPLFAFLRAIPSGFGLGGIFAIAVGWIVILVIIDIAWAEIYARMAYKRWFYEFTDTNLKIEHGIIWKHYKSIPYERVQNVDIHRGVIARILGFSSVVIHTAGYSGGYSGYGGYAAAKFGAEGLIPAVNTEEAENIRGFLMKKIGKRGRGL